jgi:hypothetical protein
MSSVLACCSINRPSSGAQRSAHDTSGNVSGERQCHYKAFMSVLTVKQPAVRLVDAHEALPDQPSQLSSNVCPASVCCPPRPAAAPAVAPPLSLDKTPRHSSASVRPAGFAARLQHHGHGLGAPAVAGIRYLMCKIPSLSKQAAGWLAGSWQDLLVQLPAAGEKQARLSDALPVRRCITCARRQMCRRVLGAGSAPQPCVGVAAACAAGGELRPTDAPARRVQIHNEIMCMLS